MKGLGVAPCSEESTRLGVFSEQTSGGAKRYLSRAGRLRHVGREGSCIKPDKTKRRANAHLNALVRMKGLEPSRPEALAPKASVSTNSTTSACDYYNRNVLLFARGLALGHVPRPRNSVK